MRRPLSYDARASVTPTTAAAVHAHRRGTATTIAPARIVPATSAARAWPSESASRDDGVKVLTRVARSAICSSGISAAAATSKAQTGSTTARARGAPRAIQAHSPIARSGSAVMR